MRGIHSNPRLALRRTIVAGTLLFIVLVACDDPVGQSYLTPTLATIWPNEDGRFWTFDLVQRTWSEPGVPVYARPEDVPPITLDDVEAFLDVDRPGSNIVTEVGLYRLRFAGMAEIPGGRLVQNLFEEIAELVPGKPAREGTFEDALLARIARARPDLREKIAARFGGEIPSSTQSLEWPLILHGGAWEKTLWEIGTYGDLDDQLAWLYLDADLQPRTEFEFQLIPALADDVFLLCRILGRTTIDTRIGRLRGALECLYVVDYGVAPYFDGEVAGYFRLVDYGVVTYVPDVGPVRCLERRFEGPGTTPGDPVRRAGDTWLDIFETGFPVDGTAAPLPAVESR